MANSSKQASGLRPLPPVATFDDRPVKLWQAAALFLFAIASGFFGIYSSTAPLF